MAGFFVQLPSAFAQAGQPTSDPIRDSKLHFGPFHFTPHLEFRNFGVDTNVFNATGEQTPDFTFTLAPSVDTGVRFTRRVLLTARTGADFVYFAKYSDQRSVDPNVALTAEVYARRITLSFGGGLNRTRQRTNQDLDQRIRKNMESISAGLSFDVSPKLALNMSVSGSSQEFEKILVRGIQLQESLNQNAQVVSFGVRYVLSPLTTFVMQVDRGQTRFPFTPEKNANSVKVLPGLNFKPRALVSGRLAIGFEDFAPKDPRVPTYRGPLMDTNLSYTLLGSTQLSGSLGRSTSYSYELIEPYFVNTSLGGGIRRELVRAYDIELHAQRASSAYRRIGPAIGAARVDVTRTYQLSLGYRLSKDTRLGLGVSRWSRESNTRGDRAYKGFRFGLFVNYAT